MNKNKLMLVLCILIFAGAGVYLTFISGNVNKYDSEVEAYQMDINKHTDIDSGWVYSPIYYFKVNGKEYKCSSKTSSSATPNERKNKVYYDSKNPEKCITEYETSSNRVGGIICLVVAIVIVVLAIKKPSPNIENFDENNIDPEKERRLEENIEKVADVITNVQLIIKRVILGIIIGVLIVLIIIDTMLVKQTIRSKDFIDTIATYIEKKEDEEESVFDDYIYTFKDKSGNDKQIVVSISKDKTPENEIRIKYNEKNPEDYYEENSTLDRTGIIWYVVKIVSLVLLIFLFFNKKLLSKIHLMIG